MDVIDKLLTGYNTAIHSTICMFPSKFNPSNIHSVWQRMNTLWAKIPQRRVKFKLGDLVRITKVSITKEKITFAKGYEQTFSTEIFRFAKVIQRVPQTV